MLKPASKKILVNILLILFISTNLVYSQNTVSKIPKGISIYQLDNGLQVMLIEKPSLPMVGINTVVKVGSAYENFASSGMSHMLEHLLFNGTTTMTQKELYDSTDVIGGYNNANTSEYYTNYMMVTPSENIIDGMKLQSAMLFDSVLPEEKFDKEKGIVLEEISKSLSKANEQLERNLQAIVYEGHALSLPTLGTYSTIQNMNRNDVYKFYKNYYVPNNMIISVIGSFNSKEMLKNIKDIYGKYVPNQIEYPSDKKLATDFDIVENYNTNKVFHRFYSGKNTQVQLLFELETPDNLEFFDVLDLVLEDNSERIEKELKTNFDEQIEGIKFSVRSYPVVSHLEASIFLKTEDNIQQITNAFLTLIDKINFSLPSETIKTESIKKLTQFLKNTEKPHMFGIYNAHLFAEYGIEAILSSYLPQGFTSAANELKDFQLGKYYTTIVQHPIKDGEVEDEASEQKIKVIESSSKSATIILKKNNDSDLLAIHYLIKNKALYESKYGKDAAKFWHDAFGKRMKEPNIQKLNSKYGFTFTVNDNPYIPMDNIYLDPEFGYIRVEGLAENTDSAINFLNEQMLNFVPSMQEFESAKGKSRKPSMMGHGNMAKDLFDAKLNSVLYVENQLNKDTELSYDTFLEFGKEYFVPSNMIISVISPTDFDDTENYFKSFTKEMGSIKNELGGIKEFKNVIKAEKIEVAGGGEQSYLYFGFKKNIVKDDIAALKVLSLLLSDEIVFDIREKQGMAYRMKAGIDIRKEKAMFYINLGTRPENVDLLIPQFPNFFNKNFADKVTSNSIKKSVNMYLGRMMFRRLSSINQGYYLGHSKYFSGNVNYDSEILEKIKNVSINDINRMIDKYLDVENPIEVYVK